MLDAGRELCGAKITAPRPLCVDASVPHISEPQEAGLILEVVMLVDHGETVCVGPAEARKPLHFRVPDDAWDCHAHVVGAPPDYPYVSPRQFTPYPVPVEDYLRVLDAVGFRYGMLVQISVHGTDNRYMIEAAKEHRDRLLTTAVIDRATPERDLAAMKDAGVTAVRLLEAKGGVGVGDLEWFDDQCGELGWKMQLCAPSARYLEALPRLRKLRTTLILDHMGWFDVDETPEGPGFGAVLSLLRDTDTWVKVSGPFRLSRQTSPYRDTFPFVHKLVETAPDRLVWGSDWPHVAIIDSAKMPRYGELLDGLWDAIAGDADLLERMLVHNPARLFAPVAADKNGRLA